MRRVRGLTRRSLRAGVCVPSGQATNRRSSDTEGSYVLHRRDHVAGLTPATAHCDAGVGRLMFYTVLSVHRVVIFRAMIWRLGVSWARKCSVALAAQ